MTTNLFWVYKNNIYKRKVYKNHITKDCFGCFFAPIQICLLILFSVKFLKVLHTKDLHINSHLGDNSTMLDMFITRLFFKYSLFFLVSETKWFPGSLSYFMTHPFYRSSTQWIFIAFILCIRQDSKKDDKLENNTDKHDSWSLHSSV